MQKIAYLLLFISFYSLTVAAQPNKVWATYYGDGLFALGTDASSVLYDSSGYIYVAGFSFDSSINLATPNSYKTHQTGIPDAYLAKFDTLGNRIWSTYIGNEVGSTQPRIALDPSGNIVVTGNTSGQQNTIATPGSFQPDLPAYGATPGYLIKFDQDGNRLWGTYIYIGGAIDSSHFNIDAIQTDHLGNILVCGNTGDMQSFPPSNAFMPSPPLASDINCFLMKFTPTGTLLWGTYYGGENEDGFTYIACNASNQIFVVGSTMGSSTGIATPGAAYPNYSGSPESFIVKFNPDGSREWATYTNGIFVNGGIAADNVGGFYLAGMTIKDTGIATPHTYQTEYADSSDFCITRWSSNGKKIWGSYYGGYSRDNANLSNNSGSNGSGSNGVSIYQHIFKASNISLDPSGNVLVGGFTESLENIKVGCTYNVGIEDAEYKGFLSKFYPNGKIMWGSYYDIPLNAVACATSGSSFYVVASTPVDKLSTLAAFQPLKTEGATAGFISKMQGDYICPELQTGILNESGNLSTLPGYLNYKWYHNGTLVNGSNSSEYTTTDTGSYWVTFTNSCDCRYTSDTVQVTQTSGIGSYSKDMKIDLYPNPVYGILQLKGNLQEATQKLSYEIMDVLGKIVAKSSFDIRNTIFNYPINCSDFNPGVYFIRIQGDKGQSVLKFIKE